jgi:t-SNARE complex subunit (syntaxin)
MEVWSTIGAAIAAGVLALFTAWVTENARRLPKAKEKTETLKERAGRLNSSLQNAISLINEMQNQVQLNQELVVKLQTDVERYDKLVKLKKEEVESVVQVLRSELHSESRKSFWMGVGVNFLFFVLGSGVTAAITLTLA